MWLLTYILEAAEGVKCHSQAMLPCNHSRKDASMVDYRLVAALLKATTTKVAGNVQPPAVGETVDELVERVRAMSQDARWAMGVALAELDRDILLSPSEDACNDTNRMGTGAPYWVYDPVDGAYHFIQGLPLWSSSLALVREGRAVWAAVYDPVLDELFVATEGEGATLNGAPISVSPKHDLNAAVIGTAVPPVRAATDEIHARAVALYSKLLPDVFVVRQMGAASLQIAYTACGRLDGYLEVGLDIHDWIAGALLVREAGGVVKDLANASFSMKSSGIVASNAALSQALLTIIANL